MARRRHRWARHRLKVFSLACALLIAAGTVTHVAILPVLGFLGVLGLTAYGGVRYHRRHHPRVRPAGPAQGELRHRQPVPREVRAAVWQRDGGRCRHCGVTDAVAVARTGVHLHYDHIVPFSRNGADTEANLQLLCEHCNLKKSNRYAG